MTSPAYIVDGVRTPIGRRNGALAAEHSADLGAHVLRELVARAGIDAGAVDDVIFGCVDAVGPQAADVARTSWLSAGLPIGVPGVTIDRQCGSSQQAVHFAAQGVMSGTQDLVIAGGVQNMSMIPMNTSTASAAHLGHPDPYSTSRAWRDRFGDAEISQFRGAELMAQKWNISREDMEVFALESHQRAAEAIDAGRFAREIAAYGTFDTDECVRRDTSLDRMARLSTLSPGGTLTAAVSSQIADAAAALLIASEDAVRVHDLTPRARVVHMAVRGDDPIMMLSAPISATRHALERAGLTVDDVDLFEVNEAFAPVVLAWQRELGVARDRINVNGGAIALGHPIGASGARLILSMLNELERAGLRRGLVTMCEGGGQANATVIERLP
jgi:acetyl-CoA C-acetyltransferase